MKKYTLSPTAVLATCLALVSPLSAEAGNWNTESNLTDQGIDPPSIQLATLPNGLPLMDGLQPYQDTNLITLWAGKPSDDVKAVGEVDVDDIYNYYKRNLPQLGWLATGSRDYVRDGQAMHIDARAEGKMSIVTFSFSHGQK